VFKNLTSKRYNNHDEDNYIVWYEFYFKQALAENQAGILIQLHSVFSGKGITASDQSKFCQKFVVSGGEFNITAPANKKANTP